MDELYAFLFAGLFILLMLFIFFGGSSYTMLPAQIENKTIQNMSNISKDILKWRTINLGDISIYKQKINKRESISKRFEVFSGLFFGNKDFKAKYDVESKILNNLEKATLSFFIEEANNYGYLKVKFNNFSIYKGKPIIGKYEFNINPKKENFIEIEATSSGWKIWAPNMYIISNISINFDYILREHPEYKFFVPRYIYQNLYKSEIIFDFIDGKEELIITFNNKTIYKEFPKTKVNTIELINVKEGENKVAFFSEGNIKLEDVKVRLYYYS